jgi:hypothetical protein
MVTTTSARFAERLADLRAVAPSVGDGPADLDALYLLLAPRLTSSLLDLVDLRRTGSLLAFQVARHGQVLYERDPGAFRSFQSPASRRYCDTDKLRRAQRRSIHAFLERQGLE